jgi:hypothetical protein
MASSSATTTTTSATTAISTPMTMTIADRTLSVPWILGSMKVLSAVVYLIDNNIEEPFTGTGFYVTGNVIVTHNHIISTPTEARDFKVCFNYDNELELNHARHVYDMVPSYHLNPDTFFWTSSSQHERINVTIVALGDRYVPPSYVASSSSSAVTSTTTTTAAVHVASVPHTLPTPLQLIPNPASTKHLNAIGHHDGMNKRVSYQDDIINR